MFDIKQCDLKTLFMFRFALDKTNDTVNLEKDINDLSGFPERLTDSYLAEWQSYVKRELNKIEKAGEAAKQSFALNIDKLQSGENTQFEHLYAKIKTAEKVNNSPEVAVMTTPLKSYVNQLLKL